MRGLVIGGGVVFPTLLLTALLIHGLTTLPDLLEPAPEGSLRIEIVGEQWWWRVRYLPPDSGPVELANEQITRALERDSHMSAPTPGYEQDRTAQKDAVELRIEAGAGARIVHSVR